LLASITQISLVNVEMLPGDRFLLALIAHEDVLRRLVGDDSISPHVTAKTTNAAKQAAFLDSVVSAQTLLMAGVPGLAHGTAGPQSSVSEAERAMP
jgi:hypothetical protein